MSTHEPLVEVDLGGTWTDISSYVQYEQAIQITHGQQNESTTVDASTLTATLDNRDGRFSLGNPLGAYYGTLGRNTRIRAGVPHPLGHAYLWLQDDQKVKSSYVSCPDSAATSITGDIDIRVELLGKDWHVGGGSNQAFAGKYVVAGDQRSWWFGFEAGAGTLAFYWSPDGTIPSRLTARSTVGVSLDAGVAAFRVTLDVDNGAAGHTTRFYTSDSISGTWTQLGADVTVAGTTSIFNSTAPLVIGAVADVTGGPVAGYYHKFELRSGIAGSVVANPDFTAQARGATSFADTAPSPNTWTVQADAFIETYLRRFNGEIASLTPTRDTSGKFTTVALTASGITRRLTQGDVPSRSSMYRAHVDPNLTSIVAYWPMEDASSASVLASGLPEGIPMEVSGSPTLASYSNWTASDPLPQMGTGKFVGQVPAYTSSEHDIYAFVFVSSPVTTSQTLFWVQTTGSARYWQVILETSGNLTTRAYDTELTELTDGAGNLGTSIVFNMNTAGFVIMRLSLTQSGSNINWAVTQNNFDNRDSISDYPFPTGQISDTLVSRTIGQIRAVTIGNNGNLGSVIVGHLAVASDIDAWATSIAKGIVAWNGEVPADRLYRLATEEDLPLVHVSSGLSGDSVTMGDQLSETIAALLQECADSDGCTLYEPREVFGLAYRTRISQYARLPVLRLSHSAHQLSAPLTPVYDDQGTRNDVTVNRVNGSSARAEETLGPLSTQDPPDGVGRYNTSYDLSLETDAQLPYQAYWKLHLGTTDEPRYPKLSVQLYSREFTDTLRTMALVTDVGDRVAVTSPPADMDPNTVDQIVIGYSESIDQFLHSIDYVTIPARPWDIGVASVPNQARADTDGSKLTSSITSTATSIAVTTTGAARWIDSATYGSEFPFDVVWGGEQVTVTAITGTTTSQTFTVTRSVNGVVKAHSANTPVALYKKTYVGL